jgi:hypothetical protein
MNPLPKEPLPPPEGEPVVLSLDIIRVRVPLKMVLSLLGTPVEI